MKTFSNLEKIDAIFAPKIKAIVEFFLENKAYIYFEYKAALRQECKQLNSPLRKSTRSKIKMSLEEVPWDMTIISEESFNINSPRSTQKGNELTHELNAAILRILQYNRLKSKTSHGPAVIYEFTEDELFTYLKSALDKVILGDPKMPGSGIAANDSYLLKLYLDQDISLLDLRKDLSLEEISLLERPLVNYYFKFIAFHAKRAQQFTTNLIAHNKNTLINIFDKNDYLSASEKNKLDAIDKNVPDQAYVTLLENGLRNAAFLRKESLNKQIVKCILSNDLDPDEIMQLQGNESLFASIRNEIESQNYNLASPTLEKQVQTLINNKIYLEHTFNQSQKKLKVSQSQYTSFALPHKRPTILEPVQFSNFKKMLIKMKEGILPVEVTNTINKLIHLADVAFAQQNFDLLLETCDSFINSHPKLPLFKLNAFNSCYTDLKNYIKGLNPNYRK